MSDLAPGITQDTPPETPAPPPVAQEPPPAPAPIEHPFSFTGNAREYFRIWVVNLFLSVLTLGIYSPWAKVRKKRFFYGHTFVAGANFDYHGRPLAILLGRIVALAAFLSYTIASSYVPRLGTAILLLIFVAAPWLIVRSLAFNAFNSSYRGLRFRFEGTYVEALKAIAPFALGPLVVLLLPEVDPNNPPTTAAGIATLFIPSLPILAFYPYVVGSLRRMSVARSSYGSQPFSIDVTIGRFYAVYAWAIGLSLLVIPGVALVIGVIVAGGFALGQGASMAIMISLVPLAYFLVGAILIGYTRSRVTNLTFNRTTLGTNVKMHSTLSAIKLAKLYFVNLLAISFSLGLAIPWAVVRTARYRASCLALKSGGELEDFLAGTTRRVGATGDEMGEFFNVDLSL